jgi:beta-lactamase class A
MDRRAFSLGGCALGIGLPARAARAASERHGDLRRAFADIEKHTGGRLGVYAADARGTAVAAYRSAERFAMCSTFKLPLVACMLARADAGRDGLDRTVAYTYADLLDYAPVTRANVARGAMSVGALCAAAIEKSDNTAANLLLRRVGGPNAVTRYVRSLGDDLTRFDRTEPTLNTANPGDPRDTTTPAAMAALLRRLIFEPPARADAPLSLASTEHLRRWLEATTTGSARLRAGFPRAWIAGDKTGTGDRGTANDVAFAIPGGGGAAFTLACYLTTTTCSDDDRDAAHAAVARLVVRALPASDRTR